MKNWGRLSPHSRRGEGWRRKSTPTFFGLFEGPLRPAAFGSCTMAVRRMHPEIVKTISRRRGYTEFSRSRYSRDPLQK